MRLCGVRGRACVRGCVRACAKPWGYEGVPGFGFLRYYRYIPQDLRQIPINSFTFLGVEAFKVAAIGLRIDRCIICIQVYIHRWIYIVILFSLYVI